MEELKNSERKWRHPLKKAVLVMIWLFLFFFTYVGIASYLFVERSIDAIIVFLGAVLLVAVTFNPIFKYVRCSYHCVPYFNEIFTKKELEKLFAQETFTDIAFMKEHGMSFIDIAESEHWLRINRQYISKELAILGKADVIFYRRHHKHGMVKVMYLTGDRVQIDLGTYLCPDTIRRFNIYIWQEQGILPREAVGKEYEKLRDIYSGICRDYRKEHESISEKEMLKRHIQDGGSLRMTCEEHLPVYMKRDKEERLEKGDITFNLNEKDKNEMLDAVLKKREFYRCRLCGRFKAGILMYKKMGGWFLPRRTYGLYGEIDNERCYLGMTEKRIYVVIIDSVNAGRIREKLAIPMADVIKTEMKRNLKEEQTAVILHSKDFKVKITLPDHMTGTDIQGQKKNVEKFCGLLEKL